MMNLDDYVCVDDDRFPPIAENIFMFITQSVMNTNLIQSITHYRYYLPVRYRHQSTFYLLINLLLTNPIVKRGTGSQLNSRAPSLSGDSALSTHDPG